MPETNPKTAAAAYLATIVNDPSAKPSDRLRAAEALLRNDSPKSPGRRAARTMSDADLEATARGEGGTPPKRGPVAGVTGTGPIREVETLLANTLSGGGGGGTANTLSGGSTANALSGGRATRRTNPLALQPSVEGPRQRGPKHGTPAAGLQAPGLRASEDLPARPRRVDLVRGASEDVDPLS